MQSEYIPRDDSLASYMEYLRSQKPPALQIWSARTEREFCDAVERALEWCIREIESVARQQQESTEVGLSTWISKMLLAGGVPASAEEYQNGHVDITIGDPKRRPYKVIGECKIWGGTILHIAGCTQLLKRYATGRDLQTFCLGFFKTPNMYVKLRALRQHFDTSLPLDQRGPTIDHWIKGGFLTVHVHFTGSDVSILHLGCNLFHPDNVGDTASSP